MAEALADTRLIGNDVPVPQRLGSGRGIGHFPPIYGVEPPFDVRLLDRCRHLVDCPTHGQPAQYCDRPAVVAIGANVELQPGFVRVPIYGDRMDPGALDPRSVKTKRVDRDRDVYALCRGRLAVELTVSPDHCGINMQAGVEKSRIDMITGGFEPPRQHDFGKRLIAVLPQPADTAESGAIGQADRIEKSIEPIGRELTARAHHVAGEWWERGPRSIAHRSAGVEMPRIAQLKPGTLQAEGGAGGFALQRDLAPHRPVRRDRQRALIDEIFDRRL